MPKRTLRAVLITPDPEVRAAALGHTKASQRTFAVPLDIDQPLNALSGQQFRAVAEMGAALVFVDFDPTPDLAIQLIRDLGRESDRLTFVGVGEALPSDTLLKAVRAGLAEYLVKPVTPQAVAEAADRLRSRVFPADGDDVEPGRVLAFFGAKGGSGTSTAVTNLGVYIHRLTRKRTLIVDLDAELGEVALLLGVQPKFNFVDLVQNFHRMDAELLGSFIEQHPSGVHLLSAPFHPVRSQSISSDDIRQVFSYLRGIYDYVVVDTPKSLTPEVQAALEQAHGVYLLTTVDLPSLRNVQRTLPALERVVPGGGERVHLIINRYDARGEITRKDVEKSLDVRVYATIENDYDTVIRSVNAATPAVLNGLKSAYARDIVALAERLVSGEAETVEATEPGLLRRLFGRKETSDG